MKYTSGLLLASLFLLCASRVCADPIATPPPDNAQWLKDLHRSYTGYAYGDGKIHSITYDEEVKRDHASQTLSVTHVRRVNLVYRDDTHYVKENQDSSTGFTGNVFWYSDQNGLTTKLSGNGLPGMFANDLIFTDAITLLPWEYVKTIDEGGAKVAQVRARMKNGMPMDIFLDAKTGAYKRIDILGIAGDYSREIRIEKYAEVAPGLRMISSWRYDGSDEYSTRKNVVLNPIVSDSQLHPPEATAHWSFGSTPVPITLTKYRVVVKAKINGVEGTFLLDTGADSIYLSGAFARRAKIAAVGHSAAETLYGTIKTDVGHVDALALGDNVLHNVDVFFGDREFDTDGPDGLIGYPVFAAANVLLDFTNKSLVLRDPLIARPPTGAVQIAGSFGDGQPSIPMAINKSLFFDVILDTGNPGEIVFPYSMLPTYGLHLASGRTHEGVFCGTLDPLTIGPIAYQDPTGCAALGSSGRWILAGLDFLKQYPQIDFDYPGGYVYFVKKAQR